MQLMKFLHQKTKTATKQNEKIANNNNNNRSSEYIFNLKPKSGNKILSRCHVLHKLLLKRYVQGLGKRIIVQSLKPENEIELLV